MKNTSLSECHKVLHNYCILRVPSEILKLLEVKLYTIYSVLGTTQTELLKVY